MALENNELTLVYQPIINLKTKRIDSFEALLRWTSQNYGPISPVEFIAYAEENMTIIPIGLWVIKESLSFINRVNAKYDASYSISVNVSPIQLSNRQFLNDLDVLLKDVSIEKSLIDFEVTESIFIESFDDIIYLLSTLRELGITISLDDFGTGYSSLSYLSQLPIDHLKIDRSFIASMNDVENPMIESIINMAHRMNLTVVAEGIETSNQLDLLVTHGSDFAQGYHLCKPLSEDDLQEFIKAYKNQ